MVQRMKSALSGLVGPEQNAFVPGRSIIDSFIVAHQVLHWLNQKRRGNHFFCYPQSGPQ